MRYKTGLLSLCLAAALCLLLVEGCTPRQQGATSQSMYAAGRPNFDISVQPPLSLAAAGKVYASVPSDVNISPRTGVSYSVFTDDQGGTINRSAHILFSELSPYEWRWEMETWAKPETMSYAKSEIAGKYWTVQIMPVFAAKDWFSDLWRANQRQVPEFWLAKRWSSTPEPYIRVVAEYREAAPQCLRGALAAAARAAGDRNASPLQGKDLWRNCGNEIQDFSARADRAFLFDQAGNIPAHGVQTLGAQPESSPIMKDLVGKAESITQDPTGKD
jgi:hypothetical protein